MREAAKREAAAGQPAPRSIINISSTSGRVATAAGTCQEAAQQPHHSSLQLAGLSGIPPGQLGKAGEQPCSFLSPQAALDWRSAWRLFATAGTHGNAGQANYATAKAGKRWCSNGAAPQCSAHAAG